MKMVAWGYGCEVIAPALIPKKHGYRLNSQGVYGIHLDHDAARTRNSPLYHRTMATFDQRSTCVAPQAKLGKAALKGANLTYERGSSEQRMDNE